MSTYLEDIAPLKGGLVINSAAEANAAHRRVCSLLIEDCFAIGKFLLSQKAKCQHGTWAQWVKDNLEFSERTARRYMCVVRNQDILMKEPVLMATGKVEDDVQHTLKEAQSTLALSTETKEELFNRLLGEAGIDKTDSVSDLKPDPIRSELVKPIKTANDAYKRLTKPAKKKVAACQPTVKGWNPLEHGYEQTESGFEVTRANDKTRPLSGTKKDGNKIEVWTIPAQGKDSTPRVNVTIDGLGQFPGIPLHTYKPGIIDPALIQRALLDNNDTKKNGDSLSEVLKTTVVDSFDQWLAQWKNDSPKGVVTNIVLRHLADTMLKNDPLNFKGMMSSLQILNGG